MTTQQEQNIEVANTMIAQLGGNRFKVMTGAKNFTAGDNTLTFKVGSNAKGVTHVRVTLTPMDDYRMEFLAVRGTTVKTKSTEDGVYCDTLAKTFTANTGMYTSL